jgi:transcriptional regulator GlxA family with amidase domain
MSRRTFARRFAASTGTTPYQWLLRPRLIRTSPQSYRHAFQYAS